MELDELLDQNYFIMLDDGLQTDQYLKISLKEVKVTEGDTEHSYFLIELSEQKKNLLQLLSLMEEQNKQLRQRYIESLQLTIQHEIITPLKNCSHMISASIQKISSWKSKQQRLVNSKLTMSYYQLYQLQNYSENVNTLREIADGNSIEKVIDFDPNSIIGHAGQIFKTQAES